uniref:Fungal lipase-type domain-containing protein n=1 Tax=viral metagenome TaxID=1070528 RepID=A0A6C0II25_9ZZZZ
MNNKRTVGLTYNFRKINVPINVPINNNKSLTRNLPAIGYNLLASSIYKLNISPVKAFQTITSIDYSMPESPLDKNTYDKDNVIYAMLLINNFLLSLKNPLTPISIVGFKTESLKYYKVSNNQPPIGFSILSEKGDTMLITFRGTSTLQDILTDFKYNYYKDNNNTQSNPETIEYAGRGFTEYYNKIQENLLKEIREKNTDQKLKRIFVCGHSLGASLAAVVSYNLSKIYTCVEFYGIAPPKTGNYQFTKSVSRNCTYAISVINLADCVPSFILSYMYNSVSPHVPCNFSHVHPIAMFNNVKSTIEDCHYVEAYYEGVESLTPVFVPNL